jgi:outer membrane protein TolC
MMILFPTLVGPPVAHCQDWTLEQCIEEALKTGPGLRAARAQASAAAERLQQAEAWRYPVFGLTGSYSYVTETMRLSLPGAGASPGREIRFGDGTSSDLMLGARVPLFTGGTLKANVQGRQADYAAAAADLMADSLSLRTQVRQAFFSVLGLEARAAAARQGQQRLNRHLEQLTANIAAGQATEAMRLEALSRLRKTEQKTLQVEAEAASGRFALGHLVGQAGKQVSPAGDLDLPLLSGHEVSLPLPQRPQVRSLAASADGLDRAARAVEGSFWPALSLLGGWHYARPGVDMIANDWMDYGSLAVSLNWTLWDWGARRRQVQATRAQSRAITESRAELENSLLTRLANAISLLEAARAELAKAGQRVALERQRLQLTENRYRDGHATESELLDSQDDVTLAQIELAESCAKLRLAEVELLAAKGY